MHRSKLTHAKLTYAHMDVCRGPLQRVAPGDLKEGPNNALDLTFEVPSQINLIGIGRVPSVCFLCTDIKDLINGQGKAQYLTGQGRLFTVRYSKSKRDPSKPQIDIITLFTPSSLIVRLLLCTDVGTLLV